MPFLDLEDFFKTILQDDGICQMILLLHQTVMFAGVALIDLEHLYADG